MTNYGLYVEFNEGVFTFLGGLKSYGFSSVKEPHVSLRLLKSGQALSGRERTRLSLT